MRYIRLLASVHDIISTVRIGTNALCNTLLLNEIKGLCTSVQYLVVTGYEIISYLHRR